MCNNRVDRFPSSPFNSSTRRVVAIKPKVQVKGLSRKLCQEKEGENIELKNLKLYMENRSISEENEKLRKIAHLLHQENVALMSEFQKKFPQFDRFSIAQAIPFAR